MPLYEYECHKCGQVFEVLQKFSDAPLEVHQVCGGPVERLISAPAFQFKGSGWYITDYAKKNSSGANHTENGNNGHASSNGDSAAKPASESKPAPASKPETSSQPAAKS